MTVGERIRQQREYVGMSQEELAKKMGYKDRSSISRIEKDSDKNITLEIVQKAADILGCSPLKLMGWETGTQNEAKEHEKHFVALYSCLDENQQKLVDSMLETLASK